MADDIYIINSVRNNFGPVVSSGLNTYVSRPSVIVPEPDSSGLNPVYASRFLTTLGSEYSMDQLVVGDHYSSTAGTGTVGELVSLEFDATTSENVIFNSVAPSNYGNRPIDIAINWTNKTSNTGNVVFGAQIKPYDDELSITGESYGTMISGVFAAPISSVMQESRLYMTNESMMELGKSDLYAIKVYRLPQSGLDTLNADACILSVEIIESSNVD